MTTTTQQPPDVQHIFELCLERQNAALAMKQMKNKFSESFTQDDFNKLQLAIKHYESFKNEIYTYENSIYFKSLLKNKTDKIVLIDNDEYMLQLTQTASTGLPFLKLIEINTDM